jgi:ribosomal protein S18 acetylase RimI-like enzyme
VKATTVQIREGRLEDAPSIIEFQIAMARETEGMELDPPTVRRGVETILRAPSRGEYLVARDGDKIVGCLMLLPEWSDWRAGTVLWIHSVYVLPEYRKSGVFASMYAVVRARVEASEELKGLRLFVDKRNTRAQRVYEKVGMTAEHYAMYEWLK